MNTFRVIFGGVRNQVISFKLIGYRIWSNRKFILTWEIIGIIVGLIICFSIPKEYSTVLKIAPEKERDLFNMDAYNYRLYPQVINSTRFLYDLLDIPVLIKLNEETQSLKIRELLDQEYIFPWWEKIFHLFEQNSKEHHSSNQINGSSYLPTEKDLILIDRLRNNITVVIMDIADYLEIEVTMHDPVAAAILADTIASRLERWVSEYRNRKRLLKQEFANNMYEESKLSYEESNIKYAQYLDSNNNIIMNNNKVKKDLLNTERAIKYNEYYTNSLRLFSERLNSATYTPVFYITQPSTVAQKPSSPRKLAILSYCMFLFGYIPIAVSILKKR